MSPKDMRGNGCALVVILLVVGLLGIWLLVGRTLFGVQVVHSRDAATISAKMKMNLEAAEVAEGYFVEAMRTRACWVRIEIAKNKFADFLRMNGFGGNLRPVREREGVRRAYGSPGEEGHRPPDPEDWVARDFIPESEYRRTWSSLVFGERRSQPGVVVVYGEGCPREADQTHP